MNLDTTITANHAPKKTVFFDATCRLCAGAAARWRGLLERNGFAVLPLQSEIAGRELHLKRDELPDEMKLVCGRRTFGGADALIEIARRIWWARPLAMIGSIPPARKLLRGTYQLLAARRHCFSGACRTSPTREHAWIGWLPLCVLPFATLPLRNKNESWVFMWALSFAIFGGCKWLTWWRARKRFHPSLARSLGYLFGWVGMDAEQFLNANRDATRPALREWLDAISKTLFGAVLVWAVTRFDPNELALLQGWCGLLGLVFVLHFGTFHLLALAWRAAGIDARPIMCAPALAHSLAEFWSKRWNVAFHQLAEREIFKPLLRRTNLPLALLATFLFSGLIHDALISLPAFGGYGWPTCYFLIQGVGVLFERSAVGKRLGLAHGWRGRGYVWLATALPLPLLFHATFVTQVILPFLKVIRAL